MKVLRLCSLIRSDFGPIRNWLPSAPVSTPVLRPLAALDEDNSTHPRIQFHRVHTSGVRRIAQLSTATNLVRYRIEAQLSV
jgi:hypothetical protein